MRFAIAAWQPAIAGFRVRSGLFLMMLEVFHQFIKMYSFLIILVAFAPYVTPQAEVNSNIVNKNVERLIDLSSQLVKITTSITIQNTGKDSVLNYVLALEPGSAGNLSYISARDSAKEELKLSAGSQKNLFNLRFKQPLAPARTTVITLEYVFANSLVPYPSSITQKERQLVRYFGNYYFYSPYITTKQTSTIALKSRSIESYTKLQPVTQTDSTIVYGPYKNIAPFTEDALIIHYENNAPFLTVTRIERLIEISHWGNIAVEENIEIEHSGAKLKGSFSRYDYQRESNNNQHSIKSYKTVLPATAHNIYYRDSNGNISTSQVRFRKDWIELELRPRFPLFGGWRSSYTLGYRVPSYMYMFKRSSWQYVLQLRLLDHVFNDMHVNELETSIVLPVGVSNVQINTPYDVERLPDTVTYKYLDTIGRVVIKLRKTNLVEQHIQDLEIIYNWQPFLLFHEPILLSIALYIIFIIVIVYVRLDFSIHKQEHSKKD